MECYTTFKKHKCTVLWYKMQKYYVMQKCWNSMLKNMDIMLKMQKCLHNYMLKGRSVYTCTRNVCTCSRSELCVVIVHRAQDNSYWSERSTATDFFSSRKQHQKTIHTSNLSGQVSFFVLQPWPASPYPFLHPVLEPVHCGDVHVGGGGVQIPSLSGHTGHCGSSWILQPWLINENLELEER